MREETSVVTFPGAGDGGVPKDPRGGSQEIGRLRRDNEKLESRLLEMMSGVRLDRDIQRATLNLLEDAVAAREGAEREIAERQRAEEALHESNLRKDEFLAMLAHELRNPLAAIRSAAELLLTAECDTVMRHKATEILMRQSGHMMRQVDDLLDVSRISRGKIELRPQPCEVAPIVNQAVESVRPLATSMGHELVMTLPPKPLHLHGDPVRLAQVVANLLTNACKFTDGGGRVELTVEEEEMQAVIRVRDNGIGISSAELPRIFEIFAQVERVRDGAVEGLGLGLTLVKKLLELHGGNVEAQSAGLGLGSEFTVRLPLQSQMPENAPGETSAKEASKEKAGGSRRVLVVDDNRDVAASLAMVLELMGHHVEMVHDGPAAIEKAVVYQPDVIVLDIGMPGMDGYEVARRIRDQGQEGLIIVAVTGWGQADDRELSKEAGFDAHLVKPVDMDMLTELFEQKEVG